MNCAICHKDSESNFNISGRLVPICDKCATSIFLEQAKRFAIPEKKQEKKFNFKQELIDRGVDPEIAQDWMEVRRKKDGANTKTAFNAVIKAVKETGLSWNDCIRIAAEENWRGFKAQWIIDRNERYQKDNKGFGSTKTQKAVESVATRIKSKEPLRP